MQKALAWLRTLVGNGKAATIGIFVFIAILAILFARCSTAAEIDIHGGSSFGAEGAGPVLGLSVLEPLATNPGVSVGAGTDLWGSTSFHGEFVPNNWDWHAIIEGCKWRICASIGPAYVQRIDAINGAHTDYYLGLKFKATNRLSFVLGHISDAGTTNPNIGRQMLSIQYRLQ
jgi:hypothetical protein